MRRAEVCWYLFPPPDQRRPVLILTRDSAIPVLNSVTVAPVTSTIRNIPTEVLLTSDDDMPETCAVNFDNVQTVAKTRIGPRVTQLSTSKMREAAEALRFALDR